MKSPLPDIPEHFKFNPNVLKKKRKSRLFFYTLLLCVIFGVFITSINIYELHLVHQSHPDTQAEEMTGGLKHQELVVWVITKKLSSGFLKHLTDMFEIVGYQYTENPSGDWDVMWAHDYPFSGPHAEAIQNMKPYQKVNHFPGFGYITNKVSLATMNLPFIPPAFELPVDKEKFISEVRAFPEKIWVQKSSNHRGIFIRESKEIEEELNKGSDFKGSFIQQFVDKPLLIDNRMFDLGIYTVVTSINPLRIYVYDHEVLVRFCKVDFHPFDRQNKLKYVIGDDYTSPWHIPQFHKMLSQGAYTRKLALSTWLRQNEKDDKKLWKDIYEIIAKIFENREENFIKSAGNYKSSRNFFELVRVDLVIDENMNPWLLEVNMSPNLSSSAHFENKIMYEQIVFNLLGLIGIANPLSKNLVKSSSQILNVLVNDHDIQVAGELCASECMDSCSSSDACLLCHKCMDTDQRLVLKSSYYEHVHRGNYRRVYPRSMSQADSSKASEETTSISLNNRLMAKWFRLMCKDDISWCQ